MTSPLAPIYLLVSDIPEDKRIEEIARTWQQEGRIRKDLLKIGESLWWASPAVPIPAGFDKVACVGDHYGEQFGLGVFLIRSRTTELR